MHRKRIQVTGIVQGVGFRPFVYHQAHRLGLAGYVLNSPQGVTIEVEGPDSAVSAFLERLATEPPPLAQVREIAVTDLAPRGDAHFVIRDSSGEGEPFLLVPPDIATCDDCRRDFTDPANRRYRYPFTNCTNCGPRYTIIVDIPYDRPATTMAEFRMCPACQACGPSLSMALPEIRELMRQGRILAIKGLGGFHLACDAENDAAVRRLRKRKRRTDKPFALMAPDVVAVERFCEVSGDERRVLLSARRPIVILRRRPGARISPAVAPGNNTLGVMLPYTPLHYLLFDGFTAGRAAGGAAGRPRRGVSDRFWPCEGGALESRRTLQRQANFSSIWSGACCERRLATEHLKAASLTGPRSFKVTPMYRQKLRNGRSVSKSCLTHLPPRDCALGFLRRV